MPRQNGTQPQPPVEGAQEPPSYELEDEITLVDEVTPEDGEWEDYNETDWVCEP